MRLIILMLGLLLCLDANAGFDDGEEHILNTTFGGAAARMQLGTKLKEAGRIRAVYDIAVGNNGSSTVDSGVHFLGVSLPANAIIIRSWVHIKTAFTGSGKVGQSTVAFSCEDAGNILAATDITTSAADALLTGVSDDAIGNFQTGIAAKCRINATVGGVGGGFSAGKLNLFVDYEESK